MIICESIQYVEAVAADVGLSCVRISIFSLLDQYFTMRSVIEFITLQWGIYTVILVFAWSKYGLLKAKL
jgi:hypothetical protein